MEANAEREIIEELHEQLVVLRDQLQSARARLRPAVSPAL